MSSQLTTKGIQLTILPGEDENREIYTKPLLYTLLSLFCYFEDNDFVNLNLNIYQNLNTISITFEPLPAENLPTFVKQRNPIFSSDLVINFARIHQIEVLIEPERIQLKF